jgi:pyruvate/2-oxoglutarate dehydrogenase complex dihydrolipoamide acyltransferase (E2) component
MTALLFHQITSRYDGVVKAIHTKVGDIAIVGAALMDIEVAGASAPEPVVAVEEDNASDSETEEKEEVRDTM